MSQPFPPPNFIRTESAVEGIEIYKPAPPKKEEHREVVNFTCPQCGAATAYSAADGGLTCTHCGYYEPPQKSVVGKRAERFEFTVETLQRAAHGWGTTRKELQCQSCAAYTSVPPDSLTHTCPFCGSSNVIQRQAPQDVLRPRFLIPFKIEAGACHQNAEFLEMVAQRTRSNDESVHSLGTATEDLVRQAEGLREDVARFQI